MSDALTKVQGNEVAPAVAAPGRVWAGGEDRRRPGRVADVSPELIALMRQPTSRVARVQVAMYDAPGFLLASTGRPRARGFGARVTGAVVASGIVFAGAFELMCWAWG